jgi:uncharacterized protein DUF6221
MSDLIRFLLARIDEDETELKKLARQSSRGGTAVLLAGPQSIERLRAECGAKRQLIGSLQQLLVLRDQPQEKAVRDAAAFMLHAMARPYADHCGYRKQWHEVPVA